MTIQLMLDALAALVALYAAGTMLLRCLRLPWCWAVMGAPAASLCLFSVLGEAYYRAGLSAGPLTMVVLPCCCLLAVAVLVGRLHPQEVDLPQVSWRTLGLYAGIGALFGLFAFVRPLPSASATFQSEDIVKHALQIQAYLDARAFPSLESSVYLADLAIAPSSDQGFYPSAWHIVCALCQMLAGGDVPTAMNAVNYVLAGVVYPVAALGLLVTLFGPTGPIIVCGSVTALSIGAFPWALLVFGPLFPNLCGLVCLPTVAWLFMQATSLDGRPLYQRILLLVGFVACSVGMALAHPNAVFSTAVLLIPYCAYVAAASEPKRLGTVLKPRIRSALVVALAAAVWIVLRNSPSMRNVTAFNWAAYVSPWQSLLNAALLAFTHGFGDLAFVAQPVVALAVVVGALQARENRQHAWLVWAHVFACVISMICMSTEGELKHLLGGFWYTDPFRLAATAGITALPLATLGMTRLAQALSAWLPRAAAWVRGQKVSARKLAALPLGTALAVLTFLIIIPTFTVPGMGTVETEFTNLRLDVQRKYAMNNPYSEQEHAFVQQVKQLVPEDALIINDPLDGSILAYGFDDLRCYYRLRWGYGDETETPQSAIIRQHLCDIAFDEQVRSAVDAVGAQYVLQLDHRGSTDSFLVWYYDPTKFFGITSINEQTPGFELVLEQDNLKLYKIAA